MLASVDLTTLGVHELTYEAVAIEIKDTKDKDIVSMNNSPEKAPLNQGKFQALTSPWRRALAAGDSSLLMVAVISTRH